MVKVSIIVSKTVKIGPKGVLNDVIGRKTVEVRKKFFFQNILNFIRNKTFHGLRSKNEVKVA